MSCLMRVYGKNFAVDDFVAASDLPFYAVWRQGQAKSETRKHEYSGFSLLVSDADFDQLPHQIADAISFLQIHQAQLQPLIEIAEIESKVLDFAVEERNAFVQCDVFPAQLLKIAGELDLDLEVSRYAKTSD